jgi:hypothetical protein
MSYVVLYLSMLACSGSPDSASPEETADTSPYVAPDTDEGCESLEIRHDDADPDPPAAGDSWTVWLYCDEALMTGAMIVQFDPTDFATVDENVVTFAYAGTGTLRVQVGSYRAEEPVTVTE